MIIRQTWDMDVLFPSGMHSRKLCQHLRAIQRDVEAINDRAIDRSTNSDMLAANCHSIGLLLTDVESFIKCHQRLGHAVPEDLRKMVANERQQLDQALDMLDQRLLQTSNPEWQRILASPHTQSFTACLRYRRAELEQPAASSLQAWLRRNLMQPSSYEAMRQAISTFEPLRAEAQALCALGPPLTARPAAPERITDQIATDIYTIVARLSKHMADSMAYMLQHGWVHVADATEDCGTIFPFPSKMASRIFLTRTEISTIAHELGHAYHYQRCYDAAYMSGLMPQPLAQLEIPATFAQHVISKGLTSTPNIQQRRNGLRVQTFYALQRVNPDAAALGESEHGVDGLDYTVAHLISAALYSRSRNDGSAFTAGYQRMLPTLGRTTLEDWALQHLGADLTDSSFWQHAVDEVSADVRDFIALHH